MRLANARIIQTLLLAVIALIMFGCGYGFKSQGSDALPKEMRTLFIDKVENPTTEAWLGPKLRSLLRDELTRRGWTRWTDRESADGLVTITVHRFTRETTVKNESEDSSKFSASVTLSATIRNPDNGQEVWSSGQLSSSESYYLVGQATEETAGQSAADLAIRDLADRLSQGYQRMGRPGLLFLICPDSELIHEQVRAVMQGAQNAQTKTFWGDDDKPFQVISGRNSRSSACFPRPRPWWFGVPSTSRPPNGTSSARP